MIKITFLGTSASIPTTERNHTAILLNYHSENILVDCGEGTQRQFRRAGLNLGKITRLLISHWHGDHVLGIPGLLQTLALGNYNKTLYIYGPHGTKKYMEALLKTFKFVKDIKLNINEINGGKFFEARDFYLEAKSMIHGIPTNAYSFVKKGNLRIDKEKLKKSRLPHGPLLQKLKEGKDVFYKGKKYLAKYLTFREKGKKISFVLDTGFNKRIPDFVKNSDLLICEASFDSEHKNTAKEYKHLTSQQAAEIARRAKVKKLILTHISQRYDKEPEKLVAEAKKIFKSSVLVKDLDVLDV